MTDTIVGMFWNRNEADILEEILEDAIKHVDTLFIADDNSADKSPDIIRGFAEKHKDKVEFTSFNRTNPRDVGQRQAMLDEIRKRYKPENTWVQIIESDMMLLDTDVREAIKQWAVEDMAVSWQTLNAARKPGTWDEVDTYPKWPVSIRQIMPYAHWIEYMLYTFRPLPGLGYDLDNWRPWPSGWGNYTNKPVKVNKRSLNAPLLAHYGYRGPTHFLLKNPPDRFKRRYPTWDLTDLETIKETVFFFNGAWNGEKDLFPMSRDGWRAHRKG